MRLRLGTFLAATLATAGLTFVAGGADAADATITITPSPVAPDGTLTVTGTGCAAASPVSLRIWDTTRATELNESLAADGAGGFSRDIPLNDTFPGGARIGAAFYCGALYDDTVPHALAYAWVELPTGVAVTFSPASPRYGQEVVATVTSTPSGATGRSTISIDGTAAGGGAPADGVTEVVLPTLDVGDHEVVAEFDPDSGAGTTATATAILTVRKALSTTRLRLADKRITQGSTTTAKVRVVCGSATPTGVLLLRDGGKTVERIVLAARDRGRASIRLAKINRLGKHPITAVYRGSSRVAGDSSPQVVLKVTPRH